jgi:myo-inositol-1-phosphate synthase
MSSSASPAARTGTLRPRRSVRVAVAGVGNCASALVQGVHKYAAASADAFVPGLMHVDLGGYHVGDVEFSAAFDVNATKIGLDLGEAIYAAPNNTIRFADVPRLGVTVQRAPTLDGLGHYLGQVIEEGSQAPVDVAAVLRDTHTDVLVNYLPVGSEQAVRWYAEQALQAGCAFVNCIPVFIAKDAAWRRRFEEHGLPIIGDDIKSQVGATIVHRVLARLFRDRGVALERTSQLNVGGNTDFLNMLERSRLESKKISKTTSVTSQLEEEIEPENIHVGPSDYVPWLTDRKWAHIRLEGRAFGDVPLNLELKLEVWDSPNSAGVVIDAVRCAKLALDRGIGGALEGPSAYFMKSPPIQHRDEVARQMVEAFIQDMTQGRTAQVEREAALTA